MTLNICILYEAYLSSYGDTGNLKILENRAKEHGLDVIVHRVSVGETFDQDAYDIVLMGGAQYFEQQIVIEDLRKGNGERLKAYVEAGGVGLFICGSYQMLGETYFDVEGNDVAGIGVLPVVTKKSETRMVGDIIVEDEAGNIYVGFENHVGITDIGELQPFGKVHHGFGNDGKSGYEGCVYKNVIASYMHGPILSNNPHLTDKLIRMGLESKGHIVDELEKLDDSLEIAATKQILEKHGLINLVRKV